MQRDGSGNDRYSQRAQRTGRNVARQERPSPDFSQQAMDRALRRRKHRKHMLAVFYLFLFLAVLGTAAALSLTVLFKITDISVQGTSRYQHQQIIEASGIKTGDNLFLVKTKEDAQKVRQALPYLGTVKISRKFPSGITINIQEESTAGAAACGSGYAIIGRDGNVLETASKVPDGCMTIKGLKVKKAQPGTPLQLSDSSQESAFQSTLSAVNESGLGKITAADFSQPSRILLV
ncbi:MAG TPA: FtsQ-type POTRA domain-containing protein, partial [Armatimonadota bacterium]|nr:FtsQ-type POTRA domain-containing protein [Armatimonadota bacterium]